MVVAAAVAVVVALAAATGTAEVVAAPVAAMAELLSVTESIPAPGDLSDPVLLAGSHTGSVLVAALLPGLRCMIKAPPAAPATVEITTDHPAAPAP